MVREAIYSPHHDFYIDWAVRECGYDMRTFHIHKKYEIYYQADGPRRYYIEDASYLVNAGSVVLIGPDSVHKATSIENMAHSRYVINFNQDYLAGIQALFPDVNLLTCFDAGFHVLPIAPRKQPNVHALCRRLWDCYQEETPQTDAMRRICLAELLMLLAEYADDARQKYVERITNPLIDKIRSHISAHYTEHLTLSGIAAEFYISPAYLSRLFKKTTNLSLVEYINSVRLTAAKNLLESTDTRIARIGEEAGFSTTTHFSRIFKQGTGLSPQQYRKYFHNSRREA